MKIVNGIRLVKLSNFVSTAIRFIPNANLEYKGKATKLDVTHNYLIFYKLDLHEYQFMTSNFTDPVPWISIPNEFPYDQTKRSSILHISFVAFYGFSQRHEYLINMYPTFHNNYLPLHCNGGWIWVFRRFTRGDACYDLQIDENL